MPRPRLGKLPARYALLLNPYSHERLSRCPMCRKLTHPRKFALFIHVEGWGPLAQGKTCRYCSRCEMVIVHRHEMDAEMAHSMAKVAPQFVGGKYLVMGTVDKKAWQAGMRGEGPTMLGMLEHVADFKKRINLAVTPGGWGPAVRR